MLLYDHKQNHPRLRKHHLYFPRKHYRAAGPIAWAFRNLPENIVMMDEWAHGFYHAIQYPKYPVMPSKEEMLEAIAHSVDAQKYRDLLEENGWKQNRR